MAASNRCQAKGHVGEKQELEKYLLNKRKTTN